MQDSDPRVDVYFQACAWADRPFMMEHGERTWKQFCGENPCSFERLMTMDNLDAHLQEEYRQFLRNETGTLAWYGAPD